MKILVPATSANMGPGFDSLGVALKFYNQIEIQRSKIFSVSVFGEGAKALKMKRSNIFLNVFREHYEALVGNGSAFRFRFENSIPLSRGMGSSSAVIVSAIYAAHIMAQNTVDKHAVLKAALKHEHHPDNITPATFGGFCVCVAENDTISFVRTVLDDRLRAVMVIPDKPISTRQSRGLLPKRIGLKDTVFNLSRSSLLTAALIQKQYDALIAASQDRLHQDIRMRLLPALFDVRKTALANGALMSALSGSGSSFFNLAANDDDAQKIAAQMRKKFPYFRTEILEFDAQGVHSKE
ncbi:MAG: homoserine kinase [Helicobacteraceae bacterium]|nr:homoserine kinase [Helicobacteraceae bacterium]